MDDTSIGIDLGGTKLLMVCGDVVDRSETGACFLPATLEARIRAFAAKHRLRPSGIGIAVPGLVDRSTGRIVVCDVLPRMAGWRPCERLADLDCKIAVVNDVKAALAEELFDAEPGTTAGVVMAGTAVGAAFIVAGRPLLGACGWAGELGYLPIWIGSEVKRLDELAGGSFMAARRGVQGHEMAELAGAGDAAALTIIGEGGFALGIGLAAIINLLNPARLAVGGGALSLPGYWNAAKSAAGQYSLPELWRACTLTQVRAGEKVAALGAIRLVQA